MSAAAPHTFVRIAKSVGPACVQDLGRPGYLAMGLPPGGSLAPRSLRALNAALGNADHAAGLDVFGSLTFALSRAARVAIDGEAPFILDADVLHTVSTRGHRLRVVAFEGGLEVPLVFGGRGLLPSARLGGTEGRWLRAGDLLPLGAPSGDLRSPGPVLPTEELPRAPLDALVLPLHRGPDSGVLLEPEAVSAATFRIAPSSDRSGLRLAGAPLPSAARPAGTPSIPLVAGAVQLPPGGLPVIVGPDHPVTGGYPVIGVVAHRSLEPLFVAPIGSVVRFVGV